MRRVGTLSIATVLLFYVFHADAFLPQRPIVSNTRIHSSAEQDDHRKQSYFLTLEEINPIITLNKDKSSMKVVNAFGLWCAVVSLTLAPIWTLAMSMVKMAHNMNEDFDPQRAIYDKTGKIWAKSWLALTNSVPTYSGEIESLRQGQGPCLYVANHASWLDIPILCTVLDPVFKFIAKGELKNVPCIGQQLTGGDHIIIDREDKRSQLRTFKDGLNWLKNGVPIMAFPEGKRSQDGRLMDFKGGLFSMATKAGVPIIPITISHAHAVMPSVSLFPVQPGRGKLHLHVHPAIDSAGRTEAELQELVRAAFLSQLPEDQLPLNAASSDEPTVVDLPATPSPVEAGN
ncbi:1-acyl-sn-glycerol-3-phosphate acyltransferase [Fistulifera solaris]|uniref:1-acyl-sn-glycerol-3-phosphate acyltransferase n=1 Tax=Fistulifera solaris TaxID=1519565 RepID=A0A1Z5JB79_FISSO|nr:1-acyl-sn-glycerol-3-phosphate acyltransferase [Fistulifera solaris]|eukprot:GAX11235.1 1-acyl-sn-glycerol-3-phosphate acyltransferase [Fistulifera solaris]